MPRVDNRHARSRSSTTARSRSSGPWANDGGKMSAPPSLVASSPRSSRVMGSHRWMAASSASTRSWPARGDHRRLRRRKRVQATSRSPRRARVCRRPWPPLRGSHLEAMPAGIEGRSQWFPSARGSKVEICMRVATSQNSRRCVSSSLFARTARRVPSGLNRTDDADVVSIVPIASRRGCPRG